MTALCGTSAALVITLWVKRALTYIPGNKILLLFGKTARKVTAPVDSSTFASDKASSPRTAYVEPSSNTNSTEFIPACALPAEIC